MKPEITKCNLTDILPLRRLFLQENNFQIRYNAVHERGWSDSYQIIIDGLRVGYGSVKGYEEFTHRDDIFEFYLIPAYRYDAINIFRQLIAISSAKL